MLYLLNLIFPISFEFLEKADRHLLDSLYLIDPSLKHLGLDFGVLLALSFAAIAPVALFDSQLFDLLDDSFEHHAQESVHGEIVLGALYLLMIFLGNFDLVTLRGQVADIASVAEVAHPLDRVAGTCNALFYYLLDSLCLFAKLCFVTRDATLLGPNKFRISSPKFRCQSVGLSRRGPFRWRHLLLIPPWRQLLLPR